MTEALRVGVIGTGVMGQDHARNLARGVRGARLVALADVDEPATRALADELAVPHVFTDGHALIESGETDAVIIATPDRFHAGYVLACMEKGLPVLCEKPLAPTVDEARQVVRRSRQLDNPLVTVGFMRRFDPGYLAMRQLLDDGAYGDVLMTHSVHRNVEAYPGDGSTATVTNSAVHEIDVLPWLCRSPIVEVQWAAGKPTSLLSTRHDPQLILMRAANGVLHTVELMVHAQYGYDVRCELVCERGSLELPGVPALVEGTPLVVNSALGRTSTYPADWRPRFSAAYRAELSAWVDATLVGRIPEDASTMDEALQTTLVADALVTSMRNGGWVRVPSLDKAE